MEQLCRYLEYLNRDARLAPVNGVFAAQEIKPQARVLAADRGIRCVVLDYDELRGITSDALETVSRGAALGAVTGPSGVCAETVVDDDALGVGSAPRDRAIDRAALAVVPHLNGQLVPREHRRGEPGVH